MKYELNPITITCSVTIKDVRTFSLFFQCLNSVRLWEFRKFKTVFSAHDREILIEYIGDKCRTTFQNILITNKLCSLSMFDNKNNRDYVKIALLLFLLNLYFLITELFRYHIIILRPTRKYIYSKT